MDIKEAIRFLGSETLFRQYHSDFVHLCDLFVHPAFGKLPLVPISITQVPGRPPQVPYARLLLCASERSRRDSWHSPSLTVSVLNLSPAD